MSELLAWNGLLVLLGLFLMWIGHSRCRQPDAPPLFQDPLDNPFGRREWYTSTGNRLRAIGFVIALLGAAICLWRLIRMAWD